MSAGVRAASHAGAWYVADRENLLGQLRGWLDGARLTEKRAKAVIVPHAGYSYSGPTAAWAYKHVDGEGGRRVVLLGPSHHVFIEGCALPCSGIYATPLGPLPIDQEAVAALRAAAPFEQLTIDAEEEEHSLEMQLPYIRQVFSGRDITLVPIMVGQLIPSQEEVFARALQPLFEDPQTVFVVSSDFCVRVVFSTGVPGSDTRPTTLPKGKSGSPSKLWTGKVCSSSSRATLRKLSSVLFAVI